MPPLPEQLGQRAADVHRRPRQQVGLGPDDAVAVVGLEAGVDVGGQAQSPGGDRVHLVLLPGQRCGELAEPDGERLGRLGGDLAKTPPARLGRDLREQPPARGASTRSSARAGAGTDASRQARSTSRSRRWMTGPLIAAAEPRRRRLLEPMGLVEDHRVVLRQHRRRVGPAAQRRDRRSRARGSTITSSACEARSRAASEKQLAGEGAAATEAAVGADGDLRPDASGRLDLELGAVAGLGRLDPAAHRVEGGAVLRPREELPAEQLEPVQAVPAQVVLAALEHRDAELAARARQRRSGRPSSAAAPGAPSSPSRRPRAGPTRAPGSGRRGSCRCPVPASARRCSPIASADSTAAASAACSGRGS